MCEYYKLDLTTAYAKDFEKAFEIYNSFIRGVAEGWVIGLSFNRYYGPQIDDHLTIRLNFIDYAKGKENAEKIIETLKNKKLIHGRSEWKKFNEISAVERATEIATKCACLLKDELDKDTEAVPAFRETPLEFILSFESIFLNRLGFPIDFQKYGLIKNLEGISSRCAEKLKNDFTDVNIDFLERFLHHFRNCMNVDINTETHIKIELAYRKMLTDLAHGR